MFLYGKMAANGIAVMSWLAANPGLRTGSAEIARARSISKPLTAKLLTQLAAAGLVDGQPGPGGGYSLARDPRRIRLIEIVECFEATSAPSLCPFGPGWCGKQDPCPLHDALLALQERHRRFLHDTRLSVFAPTSASSRPRRKIR